jgi:hypothetical protein
MLPCKVAASRLLAPGRIVGSIDGQPWLVLSSIKTKDGLQFKLADLTGSPVSTPPHFDPIPIRFARFASMLHLAYNKDIDAMMKALIRDAQLPVDQSMNWAKYLYSTLAPLLPTKDEDKIDEVLHFIIFKVWERHILTDQLPGIMENFIKSDPQFAKKPLDKQISWILKNYLVGGRGAGWPGRKQEAVRYLKRIIEGQDTPTADIDKGVGEDTLVSMEPAVNEGEESEGSILDTPEYATGTQAQEQVEDDIDMGDYRAPWERRTPGKFTEPFGEWLAKKYSISIVEQILRILSILYNDMKTYKKMPKIKDVEEEWQALEKQYAEALPEGMISTKQRKFKTLFNNLPSLISAYVGIHYRGQESTLPTVVRILNNIGKEERQREREGQEETPNGTPAPTEEAAMRGLPVEGKFSAAKKQWETPRCKACGITKDVKKCPGCEDKFCSLCVRDHHANYPGHDGVGKTSAYAWTPHKGDWFECSEYHATLPNGGKGMKHQVASIAAATVQDTNGIGHYIIDCRPSTPDAGV